MPIPTPSTSLVQRRLRKHEVFDQLLAAILDGTLSPGERLRDIELQEWLGVSRTPIRLAFERLGDLQLVETRSNHSTRVSPACPDRIPHAVETMCALWSLAARRGIPTLSTRQAETGIRALRRAAGVCRGDEIVSVPEAVEVMRRALFFFSQHSGNALLERLVVKVGADLRFQLGAPGSPTDILAFCDVFDDLAAAVDRRDAGEAVAVFERVRERLAPRHDGGPVAARVEGVGAGAEMAGAGR